VQWRRIKRKVYTDDPRRKVILARISWAIRHLPPRAVVLFMDEQGPITVKRYGGSVWTTAKRVVLPKYQKTRGKFYLYGLYELFTGRLRWRYYDRRRSDEFIAFMRELRRWYPSQYILVILDQDTTHPQKCLASRQALRRLKIHWMSLPKKSPDDNPIETIFSLLQRAILAGSDAPDVRELKRRISRFLWQLNRRKDRFVHLGYLDDFHKP
jgi:transposase